MVPPYGETHGFLVVRGTAWGGDASYNQKALQYYRGLVATWEGWRNGGYQPYMHTQQIYVCCFLREKAYGGPITSRVLHISTQAVI